MDRRGFLTRTGLSFAAAALAATAPSDTAAGPARTQAPSLDTWEAVRDLFPLTPDLVHFGGLFLASHPTPVREAIEAHRRGLDANPVEYYHQQGPAAEAEGQ